MINDSAVECGKPFMGLSVRYNDETEGAIY